MNTDVSPAKFYGAQAALACRGEPRYPGLFAPASLKRRTTGASGAATAGGYPGLFAPASLKRVGGGKGIREGGVIRGFSLRPH